MNRARISVISDVHLETGNTVAQVLPTVTPDVFVVAGDVAQGAGARPLLEQLVDKAPVVYVPGNHEFYNGIYPDAYETIARMVEVVNTNASRSGNKNKIWMLNDRTVELAGIRFIGSTLWTDYDRGDPLTLLTAGSCMRDHKVIRKPDGSRFMPNDAYNAFKASTAYIESSLQVPFDGKTVVVTHHSPTFESLAAEFADSMLNGCFHSNLEHLIRYHRPAAWIHGHTHTAFDYFLESTRIVCNPHGYPHEENVRKTGYDRDKVIEV